MWIAKEKSLSSLSIQCSSLKILGFWNEKKINLERDNLPRDEAINLAIKYFGCTKVDAEFIVAITRGEIKGDCVNIDDMTDSERQYFGISQSKKNIPPDKLSLVILLLTFCPPSILSILI